MTSTIERLQEWAAEALQQLGEPSSTRAVAERMGVSLPTARKALAALQGATPRQAYVAGWGRTRGNLAPVYALGGLPDALPPLRHTTAERWAAWVAANPALVAQRNIDRNNERKR